MSTSLPKQYGCRVEVEVEHVVVFIAYVTTKVFTDDALPSWKECVIEELLKLLSKVDVLEFGRAARLLLHKLNCPQAHIYVKNN